MVSYKAKDEAGTIFHRFQMGTSSADIYHPSQILELELDDSEWRRVLIYAHRKEWISLLQNLVARSSERAYFEVRNRLVEAQGEFPVEFDEAQAKSIWYSTPLRCIEQLFLFRLYPMHPEDGEGLYSDGDSLLNMQLPCGHDVSIRKVNIVALTGESLATQQCPAWGARILQPADDGELLLGKQAELTESWRASSSTWQALDRITPSSSKLYKFSTTAILHALNAPLESFKPPTLVSPPELCPANFRETSWVTANLENFYGGIPVTITISALDLLESLHGVAMGTRTGENEDEILARTTAVAPAWADFLAEWLTRAVNFLSERRCKKKR